MRALGRTAAVLALGTILVGSPTPATADAGAAQLPDIIEEIPKHLGIQNVQQHEVLRFSTTHWNFGDGNLQVRGGGQVAPCVIDGVPFAQCTIATQEILDAAGQVVATQPAGVSVFHPEHNHWHIDAVAEFAIRTSPGGPPINNQTILKTTFCLIDFERSPAIQSGSDGTYAACNEELQGISVGWGDEYHHSTQGQAIDITGLPAGVYYFTQTADPDNHWRELDDTNNTAWVRFELDRSSPNPKIVELDWFGYEGNTSNK